MTTVFPIASRQEVVNALQSASVRTGADFDYLLNTAMRESSLKNHAKAKTSSAAGLFQFIENTWLAMVKKHGAAHGLGQYAEAIERAPSGRYKVADPSAKAEILALRHDPAVSALMAGEYTRESANQLEASLGRPVEGGDLYLAHFLGSKGAARFLSALEESPRQSAAALFPSEARANRSVFFAEDGVPRTLASVYERLTGHADQYAPTEDLMNEPAVAARAATVPVRHVPSYDADSDPMNAEAHVAIARANGTRGVGGYGSSSFSRSATNMVLTPQVLEILASLDPLEGVGGRHAKSSEKWSSKSLENAI